MKIQDVKEFVFIWTDLDKLNITSFVDQMDHLQWMGAARIRVQTADKSIMIHK